MSLETNQQGAGPLLWRLADLAVETRLSPRTITRLRASGKLPAPDLRAGTFPRWYPTAIRQWIAKGGLRNGTEITSRVA
jgi:hypothetical protein